MIAVQNQYKEQITLTQRLMSNQDSTPNASPVKLGQQHKLFMTKLQVSPTKNGNNNNSNNNNDLTHQSSNSSPMKFDYEMSQGMHSTSINELDSPNVSGRSGTDANTSITMNANSSRVIDSLRDQVDTLTETNLELTKQSHNLLNKLETVQINETDLMEDLSHLKNANELVNNELSYSTTKLRQLEEQLTELKRQYNDEIKLKLALERQIKAANTNGVDSLRDEVLMRQSQYDALLDNHQNYKEMYTTKINDMTEKLETLKVACKTEDENDNDIIGERLKEMEILSQEYSTIDKNFIDYVKHDKLQSAINEKFNVEDWIQLHKDMNETFNKYVDRMGIPDAVVDKLKHELQIPENSNTKFINRMRQVSDGVDNGSTKDKRRSYYGSLRNGSQEKINNSDHDTTSASNVEISSDGSSRILSDGSISSISLPGVKRTSSVRRNPSISRQNKKP